MPMSEHIKVVIVDDDPRLLKAYDLKLMLLANLNMQ